MSNQENKKTVLPPKYFVGLHSHSGYSSGDGMDKPSDHMDFAISNGLDAFAITDHGNMNAFSHQYLHQEKLKAKGVDFKSLFGIEAYFVPSINDWSVLYQQEQDRKKYAKIEALNKKNKKKGIQDNIEGLRDDVIDLSPEDSSEEEDEDTKGNAGVENEEESKAGKWANPLYQRNHLVLLAKNNEGLKSLFKMVSLSYKDGFYRYPRMDFDMLKQHAKGNIVASSACIGGILAKTIFENQQDMSWVESGVLPKEHNFEKIQKELYETIQKFQGALGSENYFVELQMNLMPHQHLVNYHLLECAKRNKDIKLVMTCDSHYSKPDHWREREIYKAMSQLQIMKKSPEEVLAKIPKSIDELKCELYPKNAEQLWNTYNQIKNKFDYDFYDDEVIRDSIQVTHSIAHDLIGNVDIDKKVKLPRISKIIEKTKLEKLISQMKPEDRNDEEAIAFEQLKRDVIAGAKWRKIDDKQEYIDRLKYELDVIRHLKFSKYFLTYEKIIEVAEKHMLTGPGRGSIGGSAVAYALNLTQADPIKHGLLFERFLTKTKKGYADIDLDFSDNELVVRLLTEFFGEENVVSVSNFNQLQLKSLIKDLSKLQGIPFDEVNQYTKKIDGEALQEAKKEPGFDMQAWELTFDEANENSPSFREFMAKYPDLERSIRILYKQNKSLSRHASGKIITDNAYDNMPVIKSGGVMQTPWPEGLNARHLEGFGFLKFDVLGLGTLRMFENCISRILRKQLNKDYISFEEIKDWYYKNLHPDNNNMDDVEVYKHVYWNKNHCCTFQFVQKNTQEYIANVKPTSIGHISDVTSIFRPGPLGLKADKLYLTNGKSKSNIPYKHPLQRKVLDQTNGVIIYQEQLQLIYHVLAGVPLQETDDIRKALLKKDKSNKEKTEKELKRLKQDFIDRCLEANQIDPVVSEDIFDDVLKYSSYLFNKSHSICYSMISYMCAYLLTYYPDEWVASCIDYKSSKSSGGDEAKTSVLSEVKALGYKIGKPDINVSTMQAAVHDGVITPSFATLKSVGTTAFSEIEQYRPYKTIEDLLWNPDETWRHSKFNKRALSTLIKLEAFDSMNLVGEDESCLFKNYNQMHYVLVDNGELIKKAQSKKKKDHKEVLQRLIEESKSIEDWTQNEKIEFSGELSGTVDNDLIVTPEIKEYFAKLKIKSIDDWTNEKELYWAIVKNAKATKTKTGKDYCRATLIGENEQAQQCFFWSYNPKKDKLLPENILVIGSFKKSDFGLSSFYSKIEILEKK